MTMKLTIGRLAKQSGVTIETVRYYQKIGLIQAPKKPEQGYRIYPDETIKQLTFIKRAQHLGFSLKEIIDLMTMSQNSCADMQDKARSKLLNVQEKITDLQKLSLTLKQLVNSCDQSDADQSCPIMDTLLSD